MKDGKINGRHVDCCGIEFGKIDVRGTGIHRSVVEKQRGSRMVRFAICLVVATSLAVIVAAVADGSLFYGG